MNSLNWKHKKRCLQSLTKKKKQNLKSITERTKLRKQKSNEKESDEQPDTKGMRHLESKESAAERRKKEQGLKILTTKPNTSYITNFFSRTKNRK